MLVKKEGIRTRLLCFVGAVVLVVSSKIYATSVNNDRCPDNSTCPTDSTCCQMTGGSYGCCPLKNAVCCADKLHCCPEGTTCDVEHSRCAEKGWKGKETYIMQRVSSQNKKNNKFPIHPLANTKTRNNDCPSRASSCPSDTTCCPLSSNHTSYGCCPYPGATCCADFSHCCPGDMDCDMEAEKCLPKRKKFSSKSNKNIDWEQEFRLDDNQFTSPRLIFSSTHKTASLIHIDNDVDEELVAISTRHQNISNVKSNVCPGGKTSCPNDNTCCPLKKAKRLNWAFTQLILGKRQSQNVDYGCCPLPNAVCCLDGESCCPQDTRCDVEHGMCLSKHHKHEKLLKSQRQSAHRLNFPNIIVNKPAVELNSSLHKCRPQDDSGEARYAHACPNGFKCCFEKSAFLNGDNQQFASCCPFEDGTCCSGGLHCCPKGFKCSMEENKCIVESTNDDESVLITSKLIKNTATIKVLDDEDQRKPTVCADNSECPPHSTCCPVLKALNGHVQSYKCCALRKATCCVNSCCPRGYECSNGGRCKKNPNEQGQFVDFFN